MPEMHAAQSRSRATGRARCPHDADSDSRLLGCAKAGTGCPQAWCEIVDDQGPGWLFALLKAKTDVLIASLPFQV
jgi:hypothetical protein